ncbi:MAG: LysM peptidoglycan-binding domain-containing protein [Clostridiaceae bacterium]|nr:LysM peptidoglycan-binding domain-containing protein [Clostridiaceae bacterium]
MSVELIKKPINVFQTIDEQQKEELLETGLIVPDNKPDVLDILVVDTDVIVRTREKTGKVMEVGGEIIYQVIYRADNQEQSLEAINAKAPWSISCNYPAREEDIRTVAKSSVEHSSVDILNGRKLSARSVIKLNVKYLLAKSIEAGESVQGENIYQRANHQKIAMLEETGEKTVNVAESMDLPEGKPVMEEILYNHAALKDVRVNDNANLEGLLEVDYLYRAENDSARLENIHMEVPISKNLDIENFRYTNISVNPTVKSISLKPDEDMDGLLTRVRLDAEIGVEYFLYSSENVHLVNDAYCLDYDFELDKKPVTICVEENDMYDNIQVNDNFMLDTAGDTLEEVLSLTMKPRLISTEKEEGAIEVNGCLDICVLYGTGMDMRVIRGANQEVMFTHRLAMADPQAPHDIDISLGIDQSSFEIISDTELAVKALISVQVHMSKKQQIDIVTDVKGVRAAEKKENPPLLVYYAQQNDSLWSIAKRYRVPVQKILDDNDMAEEKEPSAGQKILLIG